MLHTLPSLHRAHTTTGEKGIPKWKLGIWGQRSWKHHHCKRSSGTVSKEGAGGLARSVECLPRNSSTTDSLQ